jgi:hypothetical protein
MQGKLAMISMMSLGVSLSQKIKGKLTHRSDHYLDLRNNPILTPDHTLIHRKNTQHTGKKIGGEPHNFYLISQLLITSNSSLLLDMPPSMEE